MRKLFFILLLAGISGAGWAQYKPVSNAPAVKAQFAAAAQKINSIASDFIQVKNLSMLSEKVTSKGKFYFRKNNLLRMEYVTPYRYLMVINGTKVSIKDGQKTNRMSAGSSKMFQQANQLMMDCAKGTVFDNPSFSVKLLENGNTYLADMTPVTKEMKTLFRSVKVILQKTDFLVSQVQMVDNRGDQTIITYSGQQLNTNLPDALFTTR
ncbi:LolA family protein [Niabella drilacis]|uniref:Outer membrane lipoprotein-sorting protein n=1 Tax=Niabella drilacis (strain DSM 25811 / CCM 8410 / CCUG 62505 / LMG 26954 / E90) TaxID=1285928 RepID=A0A1G6Q976_NIADE|nr:outer membrane lipoprotein carrier protein LolA [Niabella drilacis]SDC88215.1 Outer membrane lipoprotein-sorting protein [Niabella drilacis]